MASERVEVRREDLYEQIWSEPVSGVTKRYGILDVALAKVCRKMEIPPGDLSRLSEPTGRLALRTVNKHHEELLRTSP